MNKPYKVLFVDDDEYIRKIYEDRLKASGFDVTMVTGAAEAEDRLEKVAYDIVCLDYMLSGKSGLDVLKWLRGEKKMDLPVLVFSASGHDRNIQEFMEAGATAYVQKDHIVPSELVAKIKEIIEKKHG